jgi:hypothetical protein
MLRSSCGAVAVVLAALSYTAVVRDRAPTPVAVVNGALNADGTRIATLQPFTAASPWNTPLGAQARFEPASSAATAMVVAPGLSSFVNSARWSHPLYFASSSDPLQTVVEQGERLQYRIPANAAPAVGDDAHMHVFDPDGRTVHEAWQMHRTGPGSWEAQYAVSVDLYGDGVSGGGVRAYGGSAIGGLIRIHEVQQGEIPHALALALPAALLRTGPVWPASSEDQGSAQTYRGQIPIGALLAIPPEVDLGALGLGREALAVGHALQDYGAYVVDTGSQFTLFAEPGADETRLDAVRAQLDVLRTQLRVVTDNTRSTPGGGGEPRRPAAAPLDGGHVR